VKCASFWTLVKRGPDTPGRSVCNFAWLMLWLIVWKFALSETLVCIQSVSVALNTQNIAISSQNAIVCLKRRKNAKWFQILKVILFRNKSKVQVQLHFPKRQVQLHVIPNVKFNYNYIQKVSLNTIIFQAIISNTIIFQTIRTIPKNFPYG